MLEKYYPYDIVTLGPMKFDWHTWLVYNEFLWGDDGCLYGWHVEVLNNPESRRI